MFNYYTVTVAGAPHKTKVAQVTVAFAIIVMAEAVPQLAVNTIIDN